MQNILNEITTYKKLEIERSKVNVPIGSLVIEQGDGSFGRSLQKDKLNIIAEIKFKSPSAGTLTDNSRLHEILPIYNNYACALSVLTDAKFFAGSFALLNEVSQKTNLPILCKDFILDPYQCYLARSSGAQAVLLIVKILSDHELIKLHSTAKDLGMTPVLEIQNETELERLNSLNLKEEIVLINNRNLETFLIDPDTTKRLTPLISKNATVVSASGIESKQDLENLLPFCRNFLIGSFFMRSTNPEHEFKNLIDISLPSKLVTDRSIRS